MNQQPAMRRMESNLIERGARDVIGGALRPGDPRRFLVEAMIGAMQADGVIDPREMAVLERYVAEHDLFQGISPTAAKAMIELARDAVSFSGTPHARIPVIARGLPSRIHRLTGYAMACEVVAADGEIAPPELAFLDVLRQYLRITPGEGVEILAAAEQHRVGRWLDERVVRIRALVPAAIEMFALRAHHLGRANDVHRAEVRDYFLSLPDLALLPTDLDDKLRAAFAKARPPAATLHVAMQPLAELVPDVVDRWWLAVYALAAEPPEARQWRKVIFTMLLQYAFGLGNHDMDLAEADSRSLR
jgi:uncharacterized tellurite resistance protein B-like protein